MTDHSPSLPPDLTRVLAPRPVSPGRLVLDVPDGWQQGRGAFGGLVLGALTRAMQACEPEADRKVRALNAEIAGPVQPGEAEIDVTELRRGNGLTSFNATLGQGGRVLARASAVLARGREAGQPVVRHDRPAPPPWREVPVHAVEETALAPAFARHLEFRPTGPHPFSGAPAPVASGWVRPRRSSTPHGAAELVALADAWWPAVFGPLKAFRPAVTVAFAIQIFLPDAPLDAAEPLYYRGNVLADHDGYFNEMRELWTAGGELLALNQQTFAWIK